MSPRKIPEHRVADLVRVATRVFIERGYRLTQMADVAEALGVSKGTIYGYVESKEALFDLCLRHASSTEPIERPATLPVPTPARGALTRGLRRRLRDPSVTLPALHAACARDRATAIRAELEEVIRELYDSNETHAVAITLIERAVGHPELSLDWQKYGREDPRDLLHSYLESRIEAGQLRPVADTRLAARFVIESIATWAMHIRWDPAPEDLDPKAARDNVVGFLLRGLLP